MTNVIRLPIPVKIVLAIIGERAHAQASALTDEQLVAILKGASRDWDGVTTVTAYFGGKRDTHDGERLSSEWGTFGAELVDYAHGVMPKGEGAWFTPAVSVNGRCRDADIECVTQLSLDADGTGEWHPLRQLVHAAGLAHIVQRSSSHTPELKKWHAHLPFVRPYRCDKPTWRRVYRHSVGWWSAAAGLRHDLASDPPLYGFDRCTDRLGQPWFPAARRRDGAPVPETVCVQGNALDMDRFLDLTGFDPVSAEQQAIASTPRRGRPSRGPRPRSQRVDRGISVTDGLLAIAFNEAGMLGPHIGDGKRAVMCPWSASHTTGTAFDSSTIIFAPSPGRDVGWFHCSHSHCEGKTPRDVLLALPVVAVVSAQAIVRGRAGFSSRPMNIVPSCIAGCPIGGWRP